MYRLCQSIASCHTILQQKKVKRKKKVGNGEEERPERENGASRHERER